MADLPADPNKGASGTEYQTFIHLEKIGVEVDYVWQDQIRHRIKHGNLHYLVELPVQYKKILIRKLQTNQYDVVHVNQPHGYLAAKYLFQRSGVFVHRSHGFEPRVDQELSKWNKYRSDGNKPVLRKMLSSLMSRLKSRNISGIAKYASGHIVSASQCKQYMVDNFNVNPSTVVVIPQAPPSEYLDGAQPVAGNRLKRMLYVGQLAFFKAPMILVEAVTAILEQCPDTTFSWVTDLSNTEQVMGYFPQSLHHRISVFPWMPQSELMDVYDDHGIFLFPSFFEGFGKVFIEAMSRGLCVVAADNGGMKDVIEHGVNGFKIPTGDSASMVACVADLLGQPNGAEQISTQAIVTSKQYSWDRVAGETLDFYNHLLHIQ